MKMSFQRVLNKNDIYVKSRKIFFRKEERIHTMVSLSAMRQIQKRNGKFFNSLSKPELEAQLDQYWKI